MVICHWYNCSISTAGKWKSAEIPISMTCSIKTRHWKGDEIIEIVSLLSSKLCRVSTLQTTTDMMDLTESLIKSTTLIIISCVKKSQVICSQTPLNPFGWSWLFVLTLTLIFSDDNRLSLIADEDWAGIGCSFSFFFSYQSQCCSDYHWIVTNWLHLSRSQNPPDQSHCNVKLTLCDIFSCARANVHQFSTLDFYCFSLAC